jgi:hypothetical protein
VIDIDSTTGDNRMCAVISQTLTHMFHSPKQIPLSVHCHQLSPELPGGYGQLPENLDVVGSS